MWTDKIKPILTYDDSYGMVFLVFNFPGSYTLGFNEKGIMRCSGINKNVFEEYDDSGPAQRVRFFKGDADSAGLPGRWDLGQSVSEITYKDIDFRLCLSGESSHWQDPNRGYILHDATDDYYLLYINRHGIYRYDGISDYYFLPVDEQGRLQILR